MRNVWAFAQQSNNKIQMDLASRIWELEKVAFWYAKQRDGPDIQTQLTKYFKDFSKGELIC